MAPGHVGTGEPVTAETMFHLASVSKPIVATAIGSLAPGWRVQADPGSVFSYSDAGFELLGLLLSRVTGTTFENAARQQVLTPLGCGAARSCAARRPRTWPLHRTWGSR